MFIEAFNGGLRDEHLYGYRFLDLKDVRDKIEPWRLDSNAVRIYRYPAEMIPAEFFDYRWLQIDLTPLAWEEEET